MLTLSWEQAQLFNMNSLIMDQITTLLVSAVIVATSLIGILLCIKSAVLSHSFLDNVCKISVAVTGEINRP